MKKRLGAVFVLISTALACGGGEIPAASEAPGGGEIPAASEDPGDVEAPGGAAPGPARKGRRGGGGGGGSPSGTVEMISSDGLTDSSEAEGLVTADRFTGCAIFEVRYDYWKQGESEEHSPFRVKAGEVVDSDGYPLEPQQMKRLTFKPAANEAVVLHAGQHVLKSQSCAGG